MKRLVRTLGAALVVAGLIASTTGTAVARSDSHVNLFGQAYGLQNYFEAFGERTPFFDHLEGRVGPKVEVDLNQVDYIYGLDIGKDTVDMSWNTSPAWDVYEPWVGAIGGLTQEEAAALPIADQYWITFSKPISGYEVYADPSMPLVPEVFFADDYTLVISIPGGTNIGDGFDATIHIEERS